MEIGILFLVVILVLLGLIGTVLPALPGIGLIFGGILLYAFYFGIDTIGLSVLIIFGIVTVFSFAIDYLASAYGAKRYGASKWGSVGAVLGGLLGFIILNFPGLLFGIFAGAVAGEMLIAKKDARLSLRAGIGSMLGFLAGTVIQFIIGLAMIIVFIIQIWS